MGKILLTGATGFVGNALLEALEARGHDTACLVRRGSPRENKLKKHKTEIRYGDIQKGDFDASVLNDVETIYHLAGNVFSKDERELYETNVMGTARLYGLCKNADVKKFILLSSIAALGPAPRNSSLNSLAHPKPLSAYGKSKLLAEQAMVKLRKETGTSFCIVRAPLIYGPGMSSESRLVNMIKRLRMNRFRIIGDGLNKISLCEISTLVNFFLFLLEQPDLDGKRFLICDSETLSLSQLADLAAETIGVAAPRQRISFPIALSVACFLDVMSLVFSKKYDISATSVREMFGNWAIDVKSSDQMGFVVDGRWREVFKRVVKEIDQGLK